MIAQFQPVKRQSGLSGSCKQFSIHQLQSKPVVAIGVAK